MMGKTRGVKSAVSTTVVHLQKNTDNAGVCGAWRVDKSVQVTPNLDDVTCATCLAAVRAMQLACKRPLRTFTVTASYVATVHHTVKAYNKEHALLRAEHVVAPHISLCHQCAGEFTEDPTLDGDLEVEALI